MIMKKHLGVVTVIGVLALVGCGGDNDASESEPDEPLTLASVADCLDGTDLRVDREESLDEEKTNGDLIAYYPYPSEDHRAVISMYGSIRMAQLMKDPAFDKRFGLVSEYSENPRLSVNFPTDFPDEARDALRTCADIAVRDEEDADADAAEDEPKPSRDEATTPEAELLDEVKDCIEARAYDADLETDYRQLRDLPPILYVNLDPRNLTFSQFNLTAYTSEEEAEEFYEIGLETEDVSFEFSDEVDNEPILIKWSSLLEPGSVTDQDRDLVFDCAADPSID
jgi:hypothetical protein